MMGPICSAAEVLDRSFLELRGKILEVAAGLDRIERSGGGEAIGDDTRLQQIDRALVAMRQSGGDRAEQIQMIFSLPYDPKWRAAFASAD